MRPQFLSLFGILTDYVNLVQVIPCHVVVTSTCTTQPHLLDQCCVDQHTKSTMANTAYNCNPGDPHRHVTRHHQHQQGRPEWWDRQEGGIWTGFPTQREWVCPSPSCHRSSFEAARRVYPSSSLFMCTFSDEEDIAPSSL